MRWTKFFIPTTKEVPKDAVVPDGWLPEPGLAKTT